ncbi:uncharacterized protein [Amphiura filiformis]|uniref:uncharacterized protein n=1 Tax=Amphiura filiformis TaxID=82378 RepID=UPI003B226F4F
MIDHRIAVINLLKMGVSPAIVEWVIDFLSSRKQRVKYTSKPCSEWVTLSGGVPQGTNMGPITFLAMINYALNDVQHTNNRVWKYVDDLTIGENRAYSDDSAIQENLDALTEWSKSNKLKLNPSKCQAMQVYFGKKATPHVDLSIDDKKIAVVEKVKLLGVMIQNNLCWDDQVDSMYVKANRKLFMLRKLKEASLSPEELLLVYKGYPALF